MFSYNRNITPAAVAFLAFLTASAIWVPQAEAQTTSSNSSSSSSSSAEVESSATASASGGMSNAQIYLDQRGRAQTRTQHEYSGSYEVRSAPSVQPPSMGSGHPCGLGGSIGISIIGGGASGGVTQVDEACLLAQMGQGQAALIMIASRDPGACAALRQVGSIPSSSICSSSERRAAGRSDRAQRTAPRIAAAAPVAATSMGSITDYVTCSRNDSGQIVARKRGDAPFSDAQISQHCRGQIDLIALNFTEEKKPTARLSDHVTCSRNDRGQLVARKSRNAPFTDSQISEYCRTQH
ncbi:hypothetical protein Q0601_22020 [Paracoccus onubensis]|uniref:hypothetical protein n=1 Tax=Paracoccus onubensis TaxID=1675788 RepID=UPI002730D371|nr:hypothetical protein [Paracoccus onubensis]MDP0929868.1 hypothetical protein [Paracoccus onubensis]